EIMIMDEVLAVGDMAFQKKCLDKMRDAAKKEGRTVLYVSHNMNTIRQLCDRCVVLDKGRVVFEGNVEESISVYMKQNDDFRLKYDYSDLLRSKNETRKFQMLGLDILGLEKNQILQGEDLNFVLHCKANADANDLGIRFELLYADDTLAGTTFMNETFNVSAGEKLDIFASLSTKNIAQGKYHAVALIYEKNQFGMQVGVDRVCPAISFEVLNKDGSLVWLHQYWGHIHLDDMKVLDVKNSE
ncbi:MAG: ABC transporter ATP-binding protein, partial [Clostridia bacterium]|nr:ABC transporter ATP-binding protein [Clostridia bacterium]